MLPLVSAPAASTPTRGWFDGEDPPARAEINTCIHCGLCLTACPTYRELKIEPDSPRGRIYLMRGLAEGRIAPDDALVGHLDQCLGCRACETVCPAGVPYGRMLEETRGQLARRRPAGGALAMLGRWVLERVMPDRGRVHFAADLLRLGQSAAARALMESGIGRGLPRFAVQGYDMTPPIEPRAARGLEGVADSLPPGATATSADGALVLRPAGTPRARVGFFTTCVMEAMFPSVNREAARLLVLSGCEVVSPLSQSCCGALQAHAGLRRSARDLARANVRAFADDLDFIVTDSAGCGAALREAGHLLHDDATAAAAERFAARVRDVSEVLAELGLPEPTASLAGRHRDLVPVAGRPDEAADRPLRVAYHDPCHLAHAQKVRRPPRDLLAKLPGLELVPLANPDWCCGSAGTYNLTHPDMAESQLEQKLDTIERAAPDLVVASNPGCLLHMARGARERGLPARMVHLVEVLALAHPAPGGGDAHR
jgi:Fe-S oxidoreductase